MKRESMRNTMHPMFVALFIDTDAEEQDRKRRAHAAKRGRSARVMRAAAAKPDRPPRP